MLKRFIRENWERIVYYGVSFAIILFVPSIVASTNVPMEQAKFISMIIAFFIGLGTSIWDTIFND